jgi:hypothetical protein
MTISELGSVGELVGSIAVLCTLVYLAVQVKHAKNATRATLLQHRADASRSLWMFESSNPSISKIVRSANERMGHLGQPAKRIFREKTGMTEEECDEVFPFLAMHFFHRQTLFGSGLSDAELEVLDNQVRGMYSGGVSRAWFESVLENQGGGFEPIFVEHVRSIIESETT